MKIGKIIQVKIKEWIHVDPSKESNEVAIIKTSKNKNLRKWSVCVFGPLHAKTGSIWKSEFET